MIVVLFIVDPIIMSKNTRVFAQQVKGTIRKLLILIPDLLGKFTFSKTFYL